jgi:hypothetical protein
MKPGTNTLPLKATSMSYFVISHDQYKKPKTKNKNKITTVTDL